MRELTAKEIDAMCSKHLQAFLGDSHPKYAPIDIDKFLREYLDINVCYRKLSSRGEILGLSIFSDMSLKVWKDDKRVEEAFPKKTVIIDESLLEEKQFGRCNYTKAHEAVHGIINGECPSDIVLCYRRGKATTDYERIVDRAASKLLLPDETVRTVFYIFIGANHIVRLNPLYNFKNYERFCDMARYLRVSKKALSIRLLQLGLVEKVDYERPHEFLDIYCEV
ncbi:MAG: hypothetical protein IKU08_00825 [Clostridia bacterium]|nr:hypothetical protein [Clostridia bacterium]